jgi:hypothetical protein
VSHLVQNRTAPDRLPVHYSYWYETRMDLRVATLRTQKLQVELHCTTTGESDAAVHTRIGQRDRNVYKINDLLFGVEEIATARRL